MIEQPKERRSWCIVAACAILLALLLVTHVVDQRQSASYKAKVAGLLESYQKNIQLTLQNKFNSADELAAIILAGQGSTEMFETEAKRIMQNPGSVYVQLLQGTELTNTYPMGEYSGLVGKSLPQLNYAHTLARLTGELVVEGPTLLEDQKTMGFLMIRPIIMDGAYWGQAVVALDGGQVREALELSTLGAAGYEYELWRVHPTDGHKEVIEVSSPDVDFSQAMEVQVELPAVWTLSVIPKAGWSNGQLTMYMIAVSVGIAVLAWGLLSLLAQKVCAKKARRTAALRDAETDLLSEKGLLEGLRGWVSHPEKSFVLIYSNISGLSRFLQLCEVGEKHRLLRHIESCLTSYARNEFFAARVGECSFVLAIRESFSDGELANPEKGLTIELLRKVECGGEKEFMTAECATHRFTLGETPDQMLRGLMWEYYRRRMLQNPARDLLMKCNRLVAGETNIFFGEYADSDLTALSKAISRYQKKMEELVSIDPMLAIGNRAKYISEVEMLLSYDPERPLTLCLLDISGFSKYNELFSVATGDLILREIVERLKDVFGTHLYRVRGDAFLGVLLGDEQRDEQLERMNRVIAEKIPLEVAEFSMKFHIGVCRYPAHGQTAEDLLEKVQVALRYAKSTPDTWMIVYNDALTTVIHRENYVMQLLKKSVEEKTLEVWYQPIYNLKTNTYTNAEALLRLRDGNGEYLSAYDAVAVAEKNQMMEAVGNYVFATACHAMSGTAQEKTSLVQMQVNLSVQQLMLKDYAEKLLELIAQAGIKPEQMALEVTETILMQSFDKVVEVLSTLQNAGVHVILDDFGSGYSSLNYLSNLPIDMLKIDRLLTRQVTSSPKQYEMVRTIVQMAEINGICVVAEGVETAEELELVKRAGVTAVQGYYYSKPMPEADFEKFLLNA